MDNKRRVKILNSSYRKDLRVLKWFVRDPETHREFSVVVPLCDMLNSNTMIPDELIDKIPESVIDNLCKKLENKEIFLASEYNEVNAEDLKNLQEEKMIEKHQEIDQFPCYEAKIIAEEGK
jgi:hypothetical protein